jgi:YXWGXW repeat-containing protein
MKLSVIRGAALFAAIALVATADAQPPLPPPTTVPDKQDAKANDSEQPEPGVKVAEKGPIHEAFAQPGADTRGKGMTAPRKPPNPIPELPPDTKPEGENVRWVSGYWHWDAEKEDFIWISGFWRNVPPGRTWQAGEWAEKNGTWMYTPGFWRPTNMNNWRVDLPEPPKSVESGPNTPADNSNAIWVPGTWEFRNEQFVWRPGYWAYPNGDQVWQPGQYLATGSGYCYNPGYWDYPLEERGLLYAPVYFTEPLWQTPGWYYRPRFAFGLGLGLGWGTGAFFSSLFYGPGYNNYYYGNYYNPWYTGGWYGSPFWSPVFSIGFGFGSAWSGWGGYYPWWHHHHGYHNPLWNHYCWLNKNNPQWAGHVQAAGVARAVGAAPRPQTIATGTATQRPIRVSPTGGVAGAAQTAARAAASTTASKPLIQPASQVARSLETARTTRNPSAGAAGGAPRVGGMTGGGVPGVGGGNARVGRSLEGAPTHAGALPLTPSGGRAGSPAVGGNPSGSSASGPGAAGPTIRYGTGGPDRSPNLPIRPDGSAARRPATADFPGNTGPTIRSGDFPGGNASRGQPVLGGGNAGARPISPQLHPSTGMPQMRPVSPGFPSRPSGPSMRPSGNFGGGRSIQISPSGGRVGGMGGMGGARPGGGGGGGRGGGKR